MQFLCLNSKLGAKGSQDQWRIVPIEEFDPGMLVCLTGWKQVCVCAELFTDIGHFFNFFFSFAFISFLTLLLLVLAALALGESCNHQKCLNHRSAIRPLGMKPDREQWNIVTWCNFGICSVLCNNCVWLKMSVMTENVSDDWRGLLSVMLYDS